MKTRRPEQGLIGLSNYRKYPTVVPTSALLADVSIGNMYVLNLQLEPSGSTRIN